MYTKYTSLSAFAFALAALVIACASSSDPPSAPAEEQDEAKPTGSKSIDQSGGKEEESKPKVCTSSCTSDSQCASSCPTSSGPACCDLGTNTCFNSKEAVCPKSEEDAGETPLPY